jgi:hypothetical protein
LLSGGARKEFAGPKGQRCSGVWIVIAMVPTLGRALIVLAWLCAASVCNAHDAADQHGERLNVQRLPNGFVEITATQQVQYTSFYVWSPDIHDNFVVLICIHNMTISGGVGVFRGSAHIFRSISASSRAGFEVHVSMAWFY